MEKKQIKLVALDLDGTLTVHRSPLQEENRTILDQLGMRYRLVMVGAGASERIFRQMGEYPIDIIGNYGMEETHYDKVRKTIVSTHCVTVGWDKKSISERVTVLRNAYGFTKWTGDPVEFQDSGMVCIPLLGTKAMISDKLAFDPDKKKRQAALQKVRKLFPEYRVFVGGSSSFDMVPNPYGKYYALDQYCKEQGILHDEAVYFGDDVTKGGGDEELFQSDFPCVKVNGPDDFKKESAFLLL
jgi:hydroxymethylpyrimidine pyrophosphatase-like HAD family hydrolase